MFHISQVLSTEARCAVSDSCHGLMSSLVRIEAQIGADAHLDTSSTTLTQVNEET